MTDQQPWPSATHRLVSTLVAASALCYALWIIVDISSPLPKRTSYVSELYGVQHPHSGWLRAADVVAGLGFVVAGILAIRRLRFRWSLPVVVWAGVVVFGLGTIADGFLPLSCPPTVDPACAAAETAGTVPFTHKAHLVSSGIATSALTTAVAAGLYAMRRWRAGVPDNIVAGFMVTGLVFLVATVWTTVEVLVPVTHTLGWAQRLELGVGVVWLCYLAAAVRYVWGAGHPVPAP